MNEYERGTISTDHLRPSSTRKCLTSSPVRAVPEVWVGANHSKPGCVDHVIARYAEASNAKGVWSLSSEDAASFHPM